MTTTLFAPLLQDVRYALRALRRSPGFTTAAVLTLALGIGANTALFSVISAVLLRPPPYPEPDRLVTVSLHQASQLEGDGPTSLPDVHDWEARSTVFDGLAGYSYNRFELNGPEGVGQARAVIGTAGLFNVLGTRAVVGRGLTPADDRQAVVVLSHRLWMLRYGGSPDAIGRTIRLYQDPYTIVGVMPAGFHFPTPDIDLWTSLEPIYRISGKGSAADWLTDRSLRGYRVVARLKPGVTPAAAAAQMQVLESRLAQSYPDDAGLGVAVQSLREATVAGFRRPLWLLLGAAGLVLLIACVNLAHLLLARTNARGREIAVRRALGAGPARVARQLLTESLLLALLGGVAGVGLALWGAPALARLSPADLPGLETVTVDGRVLGFALALALGASVVFGLGPALGVLQRDVNLSLWGGTRGIGGRARGGRFRAGLVTVEVALALLLLVGAGLLLKSFDRLIGSDPGFPADHLLTFHLAIPSHYAEVPDQLGFLDQVLQRVREVPGVRSAGASTSLPPTFVQQASGFSIVGRPAPEPGHEPVAWYLPSTPGYLPSLGVPMYAGRDFLETDRADAPPVAIVNRRLAREYLGGSDPVGQQITVAGTTWTIVGVVGDVAFRGLGAESGPEIYVPFAQSPFGGFFVAARSGVAPMTLVGPIGEALKGVDPDAIPRQPVTMETLLSASVGQPRFRTTLVGVFAAVALLLAAVGIYGVVGYAAARRTGEIGLRLALGAPRGAVLGLIVRQGMVPVVAGILVGVAGALALTRVLGSLLYDVAPTDPATFAAVSLGLVLVALAAAWLPARRAARTDPMTVLRSE